MLLLTIGIALWCAVHLFPSLFPDARAALIKNWGKGPYSLFFAAEILIAVALIVMGWRRAEFVPVYEPLSFGAHITFTLMIISFILMGASGRPTAIRKVIRHPQLTGVVVWSVAHLLANGDLRSVTLFGAMGVWAIVEMIVIDRRDGAPTPKPAPGMAREIRGVLISLVVFGVIVAAHPWFTGMSPLPF